MASRSALAMMLVGAVAGVVYMGREWDDGELKERRMVSISRVIMGSQCFISW